MRLTGVHLLLTYSCNFECDHCFVWSSPQQDGTMTLAQLREILRQAEMLGTVEWIYFEGGEPFLYYALLRRGAEMAADAGFRVGIVSNGYWATEREDALECLRPFRGLVRDLSISRDAYHGKETSRRQARHARAAADELGIPIAFISIASADAADATPSVGQLPPGESALMYRGRAAATLAGDAIRRPWKTFTECPFENLREPARVHVDPFGHVHVCQGISIGNVFRRSLSEICASYEPDSHPIVGPLLEGGPAELARRYGIAHAECHADACHLCDECRRALRERFPDVLVPDQMYGVAEACAADCG
jgi:MoaA/NifB/PqqE/SkfB family radical SAM enzyme